MDATLKKILRGISLELRHELEGWHDKKTGVWNPGDLERRLNEIGVWSDRPSKPLDEMPHLSAEDKVARRLVDGYLQLRAEAGVERAAAVAEFVRESAYTWANRLFALRCMEARSIIEEVILQKAAYAGRSLVHQRHLRKNPDAAKGEDDGLFAVLFAEFAVRSQELPALFDPKSPAVALRPSVAALKRCVALLSGTETVRGQDPATDEVFAAPDAFGWAYQYWNADEKDRVFEMLRTKAGAKIQGADIIPATQLYTEPYMVKFLVQNSLGALWMGMYPKSKLCERWEYYVKDADRAPFARKAVREITFLDPAQGSGHFHLEAFDLFYAMYEEEAARESRPLKPREIAAAILNHNLYGIDIDGRSVQIATAALWMKAKERAPELGAGDLITFHEHLVATNIRLSKERNHLELFLKKHPEDIDLRPALELVFQGLEHADELGALLQIEELVDAVLRRLKQEADKNKGSAVQTGLFEPTLVQGTLPVRMEDFDKWKHGVLTRLQRHFETEAQAADAVQAFFGEAASKGLAVFDVLGRHYDVVAANPPYLGFRKMCGPAHSLLKRKFPDSCYDLYAVFIDRNIELAAVGGVVAMVTMHSFMFLPSLDNLRKKLVEEHELEVLAHLGAGAFEELGDHAPAVLTITRKGLSRSEQCRNISIIPHSEEHDKPRLLLEKRGLFQIPQSRFALISGHTFAYGLSPALIRLFTTNPPLGRRVDYRNGMFTTNNQRFLRYHWESQLGGWRWKPYYKVPLSERWYAPTNFIIDWGANGERLKTYSLSKHSTYTFNIVNERFFFMPGLALKATGSMGPCAKILEAGQICDIETTGVFGNENDPAELLFLHNSRLALYLLHILNPTPHFYISDLERIPYGALPEATKSLLSELMPAVLQAKKMLSGLVCESTDLEPNQPATSSLHSLFAATTEKAFQAGVVLSLCEALAEQRLLDANGFAESDVTDLYATTGCPDGMLPLLVGYDSFELSNRSFSKVVLAGLQKLTAGIKRIQLAESELDSLKQQIRRRFEEGPGATSDEDESKQTDESNGDESEEATTAKVFLPWESFVQEIAEKVGWHPITVLNVLHEDVVGKEVRCRDIESASVYDRFTILTLKLLSHQYPREVVAGAPMHTWADQDGVIPLTSGGGETSLIERVCERLAEEFPSGNVPALKREFEEITGSSLEQWLCSQFFERHVKQFKKRPIAWQLETIASRSAAAAVGKGKKKRGTINQPIFACLVYYRKLDADLLPKIRTQYVGPLSGGFETEFRTLERLANPTGDQQARRLDLQQWTDELQAFDRLLEDVSLRGFGPETMRPALRQYAINDALLSLTASWLRRLSENVTKGPLSDWVEAATKTELHPDLPKWLKDSLSNLNHFCAVLGPKPLDEKTFATDPTSKELAPLVCNQAKSIVESSLKLGCARWWKPLDDAVLEPLRQEIKTDKEEIEKIDEELKTEGLPFQRRNELGERKHELKVKIKTIKSDHDEKSDRARKIRSQIEKWTCPEAETWETWLSAQPLFDTVASLDGQRPPPQSIADFITQESRYAPDINDGVRVNIAPIQKAGLLHADVLDAKDADKAIADRAEWRADERRWVREGKLQQPGWWKDNL